MRPQARGGLTGVLRNEVGHPSYFLSPHLLNVGLTAALHPAQPHWTPAWGHIGFMTMHITLERHVTSLCGC